MTLQEIRIPRGGQQTRSIYPFWQGRAGPVDISYLIPGDTDARVVLPFVGQGAEHCTVHVRLLEPGASATVVGCHIGEGASSLAVQLTVSHEAPDTRARTFFKNAMSGTSAFDFRGLVRIEPQAVRSDNHLEERALLLSPGATSLALPALEIKTDDVKASHAATSGKLDPNQLFYLESRGIAHADALRLLIRGFFDSICAMIPEAFLPKALTEGIARLTEVKP